ncbi:MAG: cyanoexosortase A system-associated protein [Gomphosphaeria aponina SAG 52.96 = DSM 107014]|uniref:Cyanoexosortase A system-associated protein n=1 Tax=Gomphosphaeria aponina SAG 52.96 = DSM 107014 TaxID=1521640 RepID=A0A941JLW7_9CHRO|nr:cyanoexosortase A system-associated protein [Gomphosphaeria aponina SAG 52.96 = DSM 107014]
MNPVSEKYTVSPSVLASEVQIAGWELQKTALLPQQEIDQELNMAVGRLYQYTQDNQILDVELRYFYPETSANVQAYIKRYSLGSRTKEIRELPGMGYYTVLTDGKRAFLSSCINPRGGSTVTMKQFFQNRYAHDLQLSRLGPWLLSREEILDRRCLWAHLSIPLENYSPEAAYQVLENAWFSLYEQWQEQFPPTM